MLPDVCICILIAFSAFSCYERPDMDVNYLISIHKSAVLVLQVKLHYTDGALRQIAQKAMVKNTGARGLRSIMENLLTEAMYQASIYRVSTSSFFYEETSVDVSILVVC